MAGIHQKEEGENLTSEMIRDLRMRLTLQIHWADLAGPVEGQDSSRLNALAWSVSELPWHMQCSPEKEKKKKRRGRLHEAQA